MMRILSCAQLLILNSSSLLLILFLSHVAVFVNGAGCSHHCGKLNISYPFRLQGDPDCCGEAEFELLCEDGEDAVFYYHRHKYLVTAIDNDPFFGGTMTIRVVCPIILNTCSHRNSPSSSGHDPFYNYFWASLVNCSQKIYNESYMVVHSPSGENSTLYVTCGDDANELKYLRESCRFVDTFPIPSHYYGQINSSAHVFYILFNGFEIRWELPEFVNGSCWRYATRMAKDMASGFPNLYAVYPFEVGIYLLHCLVSKACGDSTLSQTIIWRSFQLAQVSLFLSLRQ